MAPRKESKTAADRRKAFDAQVKIQQKIDESNKQINGWDKPGGSGDQVKRRYDTEKSALGGTNKNYGPNKASRKAPKKPSMPSRAADTVNITKIGNY